MNQALGAQAFTQGHDIYFGAGKAPGVSDLTAHELTHVVQQTGAVQLQPLDQQGGDSATQPGKTLAPTKPTSISLNIIKNAVGQIGMIDYSKKLPSPDALHKTEPKGWQHLDTIFNMGAGKKWPEAELKKTWRPGNTDWCGIFGTYSFKLAGVNASWSLNTGKPSGAIQKFEAWGPQFQGYKSFKESRKAFESSIRPGDMAVIPHLSHHFIVLSVDPTSGKMETVDGNQEYGQILPISKHNISEVVAYYTPK